MNRQGRMRPWSAARCAAPRMSFSSASSGAGAFMNEPASEVRVSSDSIADLPVFIVAF
jgi:hypothetical protein